MALKGWFHFKRKEEFVKSKSSFSLKRKIHSEKKGKARAHPKKSKEESERAQTGRARKRKFGSPEFQSKEEFRGNTNQSKEEYCSSCSLEQGRVGPKKLEPFSEQGRVCQVKLILLLIV